MSKVSDKSTEAVTEVKLPQPKAFFLEIPLYNRFKFGDSGDADVLKIQKFSGTLDVYSPRLLSVRTYVRIE
jgi:hypothetical protein